MWTVPGELVAKDRREREAIVGRGKRNAKNLVFLEGRGVVGKRMVDISTHQLHSRSLKCTVEEV